MGTVASEGHRKGLWSRAVGRARREWEELREGRPGDRFQACYRRHEQEDAPQDKRRRVVVSLAVFVVGLIMIPAPGPGTVVFLAGLAMLSRESIRVARVLDRLEVDGRRCLADCVALWGRAPFLAKAFISFVIAGMSAMVAFGLYELLVEPLWNRVVAMLA